MKPQPVLTPAETIQPESLMESPVTNRIRTDGKTCCCIPVMLKLHWLYFTAMSMSLSARITRKPDGQLHQILLCILPVVMTRYYSDSVTIR